MKKPHKPIDLPGHTDGYHTIILDGTPEKITFTSAEFKQITLWRQNARASRDVLLNLTDDKETFVKELEKYPELKRNAERLLKSILEYGVKDHIFCKSSKDNLLTAYEGNSRSIALRLAYFKNPNFFSRLPVAIVPTHVSDQAVLDLVRHIHMDESASMRNWNRINKAREWENTISREGKKAANKLAKTANQNTENDDLEDKSYTSKSVLQEVEGYKLWKLRAKKRSIQVEDWKKDSRSGSFSNHVSIVAKSNKIPGLFSKNSQNFKKVDLILEKGTKGETTGLSPQDLRKRAEIITNLTFTQIKEAADEKKLGELFKEKRITRSQLKSTDSRKRVTVFGSLMRAKRLIDDAIQQMRKSDLKQNRINEGKDYLKNIREIITSFLGR
jgi:hypothetical protein